MIKLQAVVKRGNAIGTVLRPHRHEDGHYVVSMTRFEKDYIRVANPDELPLWVDKGYSLRMSNPNVSNHRSPSLISPASIEMLSEGTSGADGGAQPVSGTSSSKILVMGSGVVVVIATLLYLF